MIDKTLPHIIVTGLPRSGTSFVTNVLHNDLRIRMANTIGAPIVGKGFIDFEDLEVGQYLIKAWSEKTPYPKVARFIETYRERMYSQYSQAPYWGFKSPFVLMFPFECIEKRSIVIKTKRDPRLSTKSLNNLQLTPTMFGLMKRVLSDCEEHYRYINADIIVDFDERDFNRGGIRDYLRSELIRVLGEKFSIHGDQVKI